ncbi:hypothetical protein ILUMI_21458 [Ignelater luminosus]|uniref:UPF3 domain-containing protein n=1 Tax=Ignelater luminosus TaxID=2038154 RepID=A0A8K0CGA7_IGNLU|nr:hypothetical protein ILUMI_21458 [Ignelater luminosus]
MAVSDTNTQETEKPNTKETTKPKEKKERPFTKVVVRRLPPSMDQDSFIMQVSPLPDYDYMYTVKGDASLGENSFSRAYINFTNAGDVFLFKEKFDNYVFLDQKGHEYPAVVEFASFQKIPRKRKPRPDPKCATIESDPYYMEFLESLKEQPNQDEKPEFSYQFTSENKEEVTSTPLLDYIKQKRIDKQRIREERREERRRKELERKKLREDERKRHEHKSPGKTIVKPSASSRPVKSSTSAAALDSVKEEVSEKTDSKGKTDDEKDDSLSEKNVSPAPATHREHKYDDKKHFLKSKPRYMSRSEKLEFSDRRNEYKRREDYREKEYRSRRFDDYKKDIETKETPRKAKKYSEKREERRNEAKKAEQKKIEEALEKSKSKADHESNVEEKSKHEDLAINIKDEENVKVEKSDVKAQSVENKADNSETELQQTFANEDFQDIKTEKEGRSKSKEHDPRVQRRIRNKDRPTMAIYQPGMLSKRKTVDTTDPDNSGGSKTS